MNGPFDDDPRVTAHVLGEADPETAELVAAALAASEPLRAEAAETREVADLVRDALATEEGPSLLSDQRRAIGEAARVSQAPRARSRHWLAGAGLAAAAALVVAVLVRRHATGSRPSAPLVALSPVPSALAPTPTASPTSAVPEPAARMRTSPGVPRPSASATVTIRGTVRDMTGSAIPGASIIVRSLATGATRTATSDEKGLFEVTRVPAGPLETRSELLGFKPLRVTPFVAPPGAVVAWNPKMDVAAVSEEISVMAAPLMTTASGAALEGLTYYTDANVMDRTLGTESYAHRADSDFVSVKDHPRSTFAVDVDTASYANVRRFLAEDELPPPDAVRIEEMVNYFPYDYAAPDDGESFAPHVEVAPAPWKRAHRLVRIGLKAREVAAEDRPPSNLVFLVDVSGSMDDPGKLPLVQRALGLLVDRLDGRDHVALVVYAGAAGLVLPPTACSQKATLRRAIDRLEAGGSTNGGEGIVLAYDIASRHFVPGGVNRVVLATDGDFNVGIADQGRLVRLIEEKAKSGVFLTVLGFGMGNLKDSTLEMLADKGNGHYAYVDTEREARKALVEEMTSTLVTVAKDVKVQVEWNPAKVAEYRLIGYENRLLQPEDFVDDRKDAGEVGAGHAVTALYEVVPAGAKPQRAPGEPLAYQTPGGLTPAARSGELLRVKLRYKEPEGQASLAREWPVTDPGGSLEDASVDFRFAAAVAAFGMALRDSPYKGDLTPEGLLALARSGLGPDGLGYRAELVGLVERAASLIAQRR